MCTVTFIPKRHGFYLGMNRDERIARGPATPPACLESACIAAIYPRDIEGGTWIGVNQFGVAFALLNWNDVALDSNIEKRRSRGLLIPELLSCASLQQAQARIKKLDLSGTLPFRLVAVSTESRMIQQFQWDTRTLTTEARGWELRHWFSSSLSDQEAAAKRGETCQIAQRHSEAGSLAWMRKLHRSHLGGPGPFSICVHRKEVETVGYTELICTTDQVECRYSSGSPCLAETGLHSVEICALPRPISH